MTGPSDTGARPVVGFDHHSREFWDDPEGTVDALRQQHRVAWTEAHDGYWVVSRWAEASEVMRNTRVFSSARNEFLPEGQLSLLIPPAPGLLHIPEELDPPEHTRYRRLFNVALSPAATKRLEPIIEQWTAYFVDQVIEAGACDLVYDITSPVPGCFTLALLGFDTSEWARFAEPIHNLVAFDPGTPEFERAAGPEGAGWIEQRIRALVRDRKEERRDDVVSTWLHTPVDGELIPEEEVVHMVYQLLNGGLDTTTSLVASSLMHLQRNREQREALIAEPGLLEVATEEFLRVYSPAKAHARTVMDDTEVGGCPMKRGDRVLVSWLSINRDEEVYPDGDQFVLDRFPNRHAGFGLGPHRCPGSHIARAAFKIMMSHILERMPDYEIDEEASVRYPNFSVIGGWTTAPMTFTPGARRGVEPPVDR